MPQGMLDRCGSGASRLGPRAGCFALGLHEPGTERLLGRVLVVPPAAEADAVHRGLAAARQLSDVIELDTRAGLAAMSGLAHERALAAVSLPHRALHVRRDVARAVSRALAARRRLRRGGELALLQDRDQQLQRAAKDLPDLAVAG